MNVLSARVQTEGVCVYITSHYCRAGSCCYVSMGLSGIAWKGEHNTACISRNLSC